MGQISHGWLVGTKMWSLIKLKIIGVPLVNFDVEYFQNCIESCQLAQVQYKGSPFTWWNGRAGTDGIFGIPNKILMNFDFQGLFTHT